jgi:DnaD/phage-associated family protein
VIIISYKINWAAANGAAAMPNAAADCLRLASGIAAKVFIYFTANDTADTAEIAEAVGILPEDAADALLFWERAGILERVADKKEAQRNNTSGKASDKMQSEAMEKRKKHTPEKPSEIAAAAKTNIGLNDLFREAEKVLGRSVRPTEMRVFTAILEDLNISPDILIMLIDFAQSKGRFSANYIDVTARDWYERGIVNHEDAEREILFLNEYFTLEGQVKSRFGLNQNLGTQQKNYVKKWADDGYTIEMIMRAFDEAVDHTNKANFKYITKTLESWKNANVKTEADIKKANEKYKKSAKKAESPPSFDYTNLRDSILDKIIEEASEVTV